jgi:anti-sigma regulatory factor (Ser/Thr protein kinase)
MDGRNVMAGQSAGHTQELTDRHARPARAGGFSHTALLYQSTQEYLSGLQEFVRRAAEAAAPLQVVLPHTSTLMARGTFPMLPPRAQLADMTELGRNPARLIPAGQAFTAEHPDERSYHLWEPAWPRRSAAEQNEVIRHEGLCNLAFEDQAMTVLCLYDAARLSPELIKDVELTHPAVISAGLRHDSSSYLGPGSIPAGCDGPLPPPAPEAASLGFTNQVSLVREFCARQAAAAGLGPNRTRDLILAVSEIAANAISYADGGLIRAWRTDRELICQLEDAGHITEPLAGRRQRPPDALGGHGLWLVNLVCDLVERRTGAGGTVTRLHMRRRVL